MRRSIRPLIAVLACALLWGADAAECKAPYKKGDHVAISGKVTDGGGQSVGQVTVLLELSRTGFRLSRFKRVKSDTLQIPVIASSDGRYEHTWRWDGYYNTFELAVALPVRQGGRDAFEVVHRLEITPQVEQGSPVTVPLVVKDTAYLRWLSRFVDGRAGAEERRVFEQLGRPDRIDSHGEEVFAWWYFEAGKVYRFRDGEIEQIEPFEPIKPE